MPSEIFELMKVFVEQREVAIKAASSLANGVTVKIVLDGDPSPYHFIRENKKSHLREGEVNEYDLMFTASEKAIRELVTYESNSIGDFGVKFFSLMKSNDPEIFIKAKLNIGLWKVLSHGYVKVLLKGGASVMGYLARHGIGGLGGVKKAINEMKKDSDKS